MVTVVLRVLPTVPPHGTAANTTLNAEVFPNFNFGSVQLIKEIVPFFSVIRTQGEQTLIPEEDDKLVRDWELKLTQTLSFYWILVILQFLVSFKLTLLTA